MPLEPTKAGTGGPTLRHAEPDLDQACSVAVVLPVDGAVTVTTWVAEPVR
jgi:hypothetical protein